MSGPMVLSLLQRRKRQTRRIVDIKKFGGPSETHASRGAFAFRNGGWSSRAGKFNVWSKPRPCPYGSAGDRLWVRESHKLQDLSPRGFPQCLIGYRADGELRICDPGENDMARPLEPSEAGCAIDHDRWRPSIHMPRWASRLTLTIVSVRVERLQDISDQDAIAEGIEWGQHDTKLPIEGYKMYGGGGVTNDPRLSYRTLWESINGPGSWDANPFVWVVEFETEGAKA